MTEPSWRVGWKAVLAAAAASYLVLLPRYDVGVFNDDALYLLGARSLLQGSLANLHLPGAPAMTDPLPGYPAFIAPFALVLGEQWGAFKLISTAAALVSGALLWALSEGLVTGGFRLALLALFLFNPVTVGLSGAVLSESLFTPLIMACLLCLRRCLQGRGTWDWALGMIMGWAALTRPQGAVVIPCAAGVLWLSGRRAAAARAGGLAAALLGAVLARNALAGGTATGYLAHWGTLLSDPAFAGELLGRAGRALAIAFGSAVGGAPPGGAAAVLVAAACAGLIVLGARGVRAWEARAAAAFCAAYLAVHMVWPVLMPRYFYVLAPLLLLFLVRGAQAIKPAGLRVAALAALAAAYAVDGAAAAREAFARPQANRAPRETFAWISAQTPAEAVFLAVPAAAVYLETGRRAYPFQAASDVDDLRYRLLNRGVSHILYQPGKVGFLRTGAPGDPGRVWDESPAWIAAEPEGFEKAFESARDGAFVYRVLADAAFVAAYRLYLEARRDFEAQRWPEGLEKLDAALAAYPRFPKALNAYAATVLVTGGDRRKARRLLEEALALRPGFALARENLERLREPERSRPGPGRSAPLPRR